MAAEQPPDGPGSRQRRGWWIAAELLALLLVVGLVVLWIKAPALYGRGDAAKTAAATTRGAILTVGAALIAATAAGGGLYLTARTIRINQQTLTETQRANREADQRDRYAKAIDQLGSGKLDVRLGGIYGLERIAKTSEQDHPTVVEVLSAYVRQHTDPTQRRRRLSPAAVQGKASPRPATDVQAAISVLGRLPSRPGVPRGNLVGAHLANVNFSRADLAGAQLNGTNLTGANFGRADLASANFVGAILTGTWLAAANLTDADLDTANLTGAWLEGANLTDADLDTANLTDAGLGGANLGTAKNLAQQQLDSARGNEETQLPTGLQRPTHWSTDPAAPPAAD